MYKNNRGIKKEREKKNTHNGTNKSLFDNLLKRKVHLFWVLSPEAGGGTEMQKHGFFSLLVRPSISCSLLNS